VAHGRCELTNARGGLAGGGLAQDAFVAQNCARMGGAYTLLEKALTQAGLKFTRAEGAMFCCVDLSEYLKEPTFDAERELFQVTLTLTLPAPSPSPQPRPDGGACSPDRESDAAPLQCAVLSCCSAVVL